MPQWEQHLLSTGLKKRKRPGCMTASEIMTIFILFRQMQCSGFQDLLLPVRAAFLLPYFLRRISYNRLVALLKSVLVPLFCFMQRSTRQEIGVYFIDKGYVSQPLFDSLLERGLHLLTRLKKNMKNKRMPLVDKLLLYKRGIIESVDDQLKNISQTEHTRHRSSGILQPIS